MNGLFASDWPVSRVPSLVRMNEVTVNKKTPCFFGEVVSHQVVQSLAHSLQSNLLFAVQIREHSVESQIGELVDHSDHCSFTSGQYSTEGSLAQNELVVVVLEEKSKLK